MRVFCCAMLAVIVLAAPRTGEAVQPPPRGKTTVAEILARRTSIQWQGLSMRDALRRLAETQDIPVLLDRRIDAGRLINLKADNLSLEELLTNLAQLGDAEMLALPSLAYIGPRDAVAELATLLEIASDQTRGAPPATRQKLLQQQAQTWPRLATPQQIVRDLAKRTGLEVVGMEHLPHDLWDAGELPADSAANQLTLLLASFDLTWRIDKTGRNLVIVPIERPVRIARTYDWRGVTAARLQQVAAEMPAADVRMSNGKVIVNGSVEDHEKLSAILADLSKSPRNPRRTTRPAPEKQVFSLRLESQPAGAVLRELARRLKLELRVDEAASKSLETRISIDVKNVELEKLLAEIGEEVGVEVEVTGAILMVNPR